MVVLEVSALSKLRHLYKNMVSGGVKDASEAKRIAEGLLSPAIADIESLHAEVEALRGGWIPVTERLPDLHVDVLAGYWYQNNWLKGKPWMFSFGICLMYEEPNDPCFPQGKRWKTHGCSHNDIKHWMPLPTPPAQDIPKEDIQ